MTERGPECSFISVHYCPANWGETIITLSSWGLCSIRVCTKAVCLFLWPCHTHQPTATHRKWKRIMGARLMEHPAVDLGLFTPTFDTSTPPSFLPLCWKIDAKKMKRCILGISSKGRWEAVKSSCDNREVKFVLRALLFFYIVFYLCLYNNIWQYISVCLFAQFTIRRVLKMRRFIPTLLPEQNVYVHK